jgi:hypothetical protein
VKAELAPGTLERVERELERIGVLLEHDASLPSVTLICAGEPIRGSWWGHRFGHAIYDLLHELEERSGGLFAKLVNGKVTHVHRRLWPAFFTLAEDRSAARVRGLSPLAKKLLARTEDGAVLRMDQLQSEGLASGKELTAASRELGERVLVFSSNVHTDSGAHARILQSWPAFCAERGVKVDARDPATARAELSAAAAELSRGAPRPVKLAL